MDDQLSDVQPVVGARSPQQRPHFDVQLCRVHLARICAHVQKQESNFLLAASDGNPQRCVAFSI